MNKHSSCVYFHGTSDADNRKLFRSFAKAVKSAVPDSTVIMSTSDIQTEIRRDDRLQIGIDFNAFSHVRSYDALAERILSDAKGRRPTFITTISAIAQHVADCGIAVIVPGNGRENSMRLQSIPPTAEAVSAALANIHGAPIR